MPPTKPVIFVPGFPASEIVQRSRNRTLFLPALGELADPDKKRRLIALLVGPDDPPGDIVAGEPIRSFLGIADQAESLYDNLRRFHYSTSAPNPLFRPVGWDWRKAVDDLAVQQDLAGAITDLADGNGPVVVVVHSTGGLVLRRLLELQPQLAPRIDRILAFGVPWAGALKAVRYLVKGEPFKFLGIGLNPSEVRQVMRAAQAAYDLFPPDPTKSDLTSPSGNPLNLCRDAAGGQVGLLVSTGWIPAGADGDEMRRRAHDADTRLGSRAPELLLPAVPGQPPVAVPRVINVVGWGVDTDTTCTLRGGKAELGEPTREGDGTAPLASASWLRGATVRTFFLPIGVYPTGGIPQRHAHIWDSPPVDDLFNEVLEGAAAAPWVCAAADGDQALDRRSDVTVRVAAQDAQGAALPDARVTLPGVSPTEVRFDGRRRANVVVQRRFMRPNVARDTFRFELHVTWGAGGPGEHRELPVLIRV